VDRGPQAGEGELAELKRIISIGKNGKCQVMYINSREFEGLVIDKLREHIITEKNLRELVRLVNEEMDAASQEYRGQLDVVTEEIADVNRRWTRSTTL